MTQRHRASTYASTPTQEYPPPQQPFNPNGPAQAVLFARQARQLFERLQVDLDVGAELPGLIEDFPFFDQMPVDLLDEERISLAFLEDEAHQALRRLSVT